jgi:hypothetical protein
LQEDAPEERSMAEQNQQDDGTGGGGGADGALSDSDLDEVAGGMNVAFGGQQGLGQLRGTGGGGGNTPVTGPTTVLSDAGPVSSGQINPK